MKLRNLSLAIVAGAVLGVAMMLSSPASAQSIFFDWGSNEKVNDSGREIVNFDTKVRQGELIVSFGDRRAYLIISPGKALSYPIAVPREKSKWEGVTNVSQKRVNPSWTPTPEMMVENPRLPPWVPGGHPMNPLGTHALYLGSSSYRIHGTDAPWTIGTAASKGCVRMYNKDVQDLYPRVPVGTKVTVTYKTYTTSPLDGGSEKQILADLDKGKKLKPSDDVAGAAAQARKKWSDADNDEQYTKVAPSEASEKGDDKDKNEASDKSDDGKSKDEKDKDSASASSDDAANKENDSGTERRPVMTSNKSQTGWNYPQKKAAEDTSDATAQDPLPSDDEAPVKKKSAAKQAVETGSVDTDEQASKKSKSKPSTSENAERKEEHKGTSEPHSKKADKSEDAASVATRALAAAERAAAAAERAANAAERASAAALRASAKSEPEKSAEAAPMSEWPVVKSAKP